MTTTRWGDTHDRRSPRRRHSAPLALADPAGLIDRFPTPTLLLVELGRLAHANTAAVSLLQLDDDHQIAAAVEDFLGLRAEIEHAHRLGDAPDAIWRDLTVADGTSLRVQLYLTPLASTPYRSTLVHVVDRTAEQRLESFVSRSTPGFEGLFQRVPVISAVVGPSGCVDFWNGEAERRLGVTSDAAIGRSLTDVLGVMNATLRRDIETAIAMGRRLDHRTIVVQGAEREPLTLDLSLEPWVDADGHGSGAVVSLVDVTKRDSDQRDHARQAALYGRMLASVSETVTLMDASGNVIGQRTPGQNILGYPESFWTGRDISTLIHPDDLDLALDLLERTTANPGLPVTSYLRLFDVQHRAQIVAGTAWNLLDDPAVGAILLVTRNVTTEHRQAAQRDAQSNILQLIAEGGHDLGAILVKIAEFLDGQLDMAVGAIAITDPPLTGFGDVPLTTRQAVEGFDLTRMEALPSRSAQSVDVYLVKEHGALRAHRDELLGDGRQVVWSYPIRSAEGEPVVGRIIGLAEQPRDPSDHEVEMIRLASSMAALAFERLRAGAQLTHQALHDELTGLANRHLLIDRLDQALARARRTKSRVGLMFIDLDRFKVVNDTFGHEAGDRVLKEFASRLNHLLRDADTVARYGGDEFIVLIDEVTEEHLRDVAQRVEESLAVPVEYKNSFFQVTSSIGLAISDAGDVSATALLHNADAAMYRAKRHGQKRLEIFSDEMQSFTRDRMRLEIDLRRSVELGTMLLHYQPIIDLRSGRVVGAEALVRWNRPEGLLEPAEFLPLAEQIGFISVLGRWILEEAIEAASRWSEHAGSRDLWISVNISGRQLVTDGLPQLVDKTLKKYGWAANRLILEVGEGVLLADVDLIREGLTAINQLGVDLAIDDFGRGTASLTTLSSYTVDRVKIDHEIVRRLADDERSVQLARAIIDSAHALGMGVVAEGVEQPGQLEVLRSLGCDWAQGFHFHSGMTSRELSALLQTNAVW